MSGSKKSNIDKSWQNSNNSNSVDAQTKQYMTDVQNAAARAGGAGPSPLLTGAAGYNTGAINAGQTGMAAMSGDRTALAKLMDPYQQQVIDANNNEWQHTNAQTMSQVNDAATRANAFGGSRHGVAEGVALSDNNRAQMGQTAGLLSQGYAGAMAQANQLAGYGFAGAGANANLGFGGVGSPDMWNLNMLKQGYMGPTGSNSQTSGSQTQAGFQGESGFKIPFFGK